MTHVDSIWVKVQVFNDIIVVWAVQSCSKESEMISLDGNTCVRVAGNSEGDQRGIRERTGRETEGKQEWKRLGWRKVSQDKPFDK